MSLHTTTKCHQSSPALQAARLRGTLAHRQLAYQGDECDLERASVADRAITDTAGETVWVVEQIRVSYRHQFLARLALHRLLAAAGDGEPEPEPDVDTDVDTNTTPHAGAPPGHARSVRRHQLALSCRVSSSSRGPAHHGPPRGTRRSRHPGGLARTCLEPVAIRHAMSDVPNVCVRQLSCLCSRRAAATSTTGRQLSTV